MLIAVFRKQMEFGTGFLEYDGDVRIMETG